MILDEQKAWTIRKLRTTDDFKDFLNLLIEWRAELREESDTTGKLEDIKVSQGKRQILNEILGLSDEADRLVNTLTEQRRIEDMKQVEHLGDSRSSSIEGNVNT